MGFKASLWDFPVLALVLQMSATDLVPPQQCWTGCEQTTWGREAGDTSRSPAYGAKVPGEEPPPRRPLLPCQGWVCRERSPSHMLAAHVVWRERAPGEADEGGGSGGDERSLELGVQRDGSLCAAGSPRPGSTEGHRPQPLRSISVACACHQQPGGDLPNFGFLNKSPHVGKSPQGLHCSGSQPGIQGGRWCSRGLRLS